MAPLTLTVLADYAHNLRQPRKPGDVGFDLVCNEAISVEMWETKYISTGVRVQLPEGYWARIVGRSSAVKNTGLLVIEGTIDTGYTGELLVGVFNLGGHRQNIERGQRLAQLILCPAIVPEIHFAHKLKETERGTSGFGSTG